jgi:hypothetical protein
MNNEPAFISTLNYLIGSGINLNIYLYHGGTSFGFGTGAGINETTGEFQSLVTSYDYGAPLNEAGDPTPLYFAIKRIISKVTSY